MSSELQEVRSDFGSEMVLNRPLSDSAKPTQRKNEVFISSRIKRERSERKLHQKFVQRKADTRKVQVETSEKAYWIC